MHARLPVTADTLPSEGRHLARAVAGAGATLLAGRLRVTVLQQYATMKHERYSGRL
jgi:hypothetical protein